MTGVEPAAVAGEALALLRLHGWVRRPDGRGGITLMHAIELAADNLTKISLGDQPITAVEFATRSQEAAAETIAALRADLGHPGIQSWAARQSTVWDHVEDALEAIAKPKRRSRRSA